jgi:hypothetical protein
MRTGAIAAKYSIRKVLLADRSLGRFRRCRMKTSGIIVKNSGLLATVLACGLCLVGFAAETWAKDKQELAFEESRIFIEYNSSDNDLGFHVFLDGEDWKSLKIVNPDGRTIAELQGRAGYRLLGLSELFFEGAEPTLSEFPLEELLALFPEGEYEFEGITVDGEEIEGEGTLTHAVPAGPDVSASDDAVGAGNALTIRWDPVTEVATDPAGGEFPDADIVVVAYQVIVGSFQVTLPASDPPAPMSVTVPPEFVASLESGEHEYEVLAIEEGGNQTITSNSFTK